MELKMPQDNLKPYDLSDEEWREYEWIDDKNRIRIYRVNNPKTLYYSSTATTHKVLDLEGIVHCVPTVGKDGCVLRWKPTNKDNPVAY